MTKPTLAFQPEAERYYAEGYWRDGRPLGGLRPRASTSTRTRSRWSSTTARSPSTELRRAAVGVSSRLADGGVEPGDVVILLGRHSIEAAVAMLGCLHRGVVLAPLPPMFNATQLSALLAQTQRQGRSWPSAARRRSRSACEVADEVPFLLADRCRSSSTQLAASDLPADRDRRATPTTSRWSCTPPGRRRRPKGIAHSSNTLRYATEGVCRALGADRRRHLPHRRASSASSAGSCSATSRRCSTAPPASCSTAGTPRRRCG